MSSAGELALGLSEVLNGSAIEDLERLSGGASRETWKFTANGEPLILQRVRKGTVGGLKCEPEVLSAAHAAGVPVPELVVNGASSTALEHPFMIVRAIKGETIARKILRDDEFSAARPLLAAQIGTALAELHRIDPTTIPGLEVEDQIHRFKKVLHDLGEPHPVFEVAFRWLEKNRPESQRQSVVHGDFRLGNLMVDSQGLVAVLDWELAHVGDPMEDLGWVCVKAWRFGGAQPVAGIGSYEEMFNAYEAASGVRPELAVVRWWEILGTLKWGIMCIMQASRHTLGMVRSHELAAIGRRVCENEYDLVVMLEELLP